MWGLPNFYLSISKNYVQNEWFNSCANVDNSRDVKRFTFLTTPKDVVIKVTFPNSSLFMYMEHQ
jgi:hypothetical protein